MDATPIFSCLRTIPATIPSFKTSFAARNHGSMKFSATGTTIRNSRPISRIFAADEISALITSDTTQPEITWQIIFGTIAGVTPFVVAGIEFSKRIAEQRQCKVCKGSGLVLRDNKYYFRCPACGGFLPWQSWRRFFTG